MSRPSSRSSVRSDRSDRPSSRAGQRSKQPVLGVGTLAYQPQLFDEDPGGYLVWVLGLLNFDINTVMNTKYLPTSKRFHLRTIVLKSLSIVTITPFMVHLYSIEVKIEEPEYKY